MPGQLLLDLGKPAVAEPNTGTQKERILTMLRAAGKGGVTNIDFVGRHMLRYGARIFELRRMGYRIEGEREGNHGVWRFKLLEGKI